jgi:tetratricopeptide (TPR) repeat protein
MSARRRAIGRCLALLLLGVIATSNPPAALGQAPSGAGQDEQRRSQAKGEFAKGVGHYRAGRYTQAVDAFLEADQLAPSPALSYNIARAYERLNDDAAALRWYRDYLRRSPSAKNAAEVEARITELSSDVMQAGKQEPSAPSAPAEQRVDKQASLPTATRASQPESVARGEGDRTSQRFGVLPWVITGSGVICLGGALGFELARRADEGRAQSAPTQLAYQERLEAMERDQLRARVLAGVGGGLLVTGGVMLLLNQRQPISTRVALGCTARGCTASAHGSF